MELTNEEVRGIFAQARELGLLDIGPSEPDPWLDIDDASDYTRLSKGQLRNLVSESRLPRDGPKGHRLRFRRSELDAYLETRGRKAA